MATSDTSSATPSFSFPEPLAESLYLLKERWLMAPNMLSEYIGSWLMKAATLVAKRTPPDRYEATAYSSNTHTFEIDRQADGAQTLKATRRENNSQEYQIYFAGNVQDALEPRLVEPTIKKYASKNHIFWDYPGATRYININRFDPLFKAGYEQIKTLLNQGVAAENITIYGYSMGGGIAAYIARKLHNEGLLVNLTIDRSFSRLSAVITPLLYHMIAEKSSDEVKYHHHLPFGTSLVTFSVIGASIGTALAGLIKAIGVFTASLIAGIGYALNSILSYLPFSSLLTQGLNALFNTTAASIDLCFDVLASTLGGIIALAGFTVGGMIGTLVGALLSIQLLVTDNPYNPSLETATRTLLNTTTGEMLSVQNIEAILNQEEHGQINIINARLDEVIHEEAALNTGLGFPASPTYPRTQEQLGLSSFWYKRGTHHGVLSNKNIDQELSYHEPGRISV